MTRSRIFVSIAAMTLSLAFAACGDNKGANGQGGSALSAASCSEMWKSHVAAHPQGRVLEYKSVTKMRMNGRDMDLGTETEESTVIESSNERVVTSVRTRGETIESAMTKADFEKSCADLGAGKVPGQTEGKVEIQERSRKSVTVPAGTFDCAYTKVRTTAANGEGTATTEIWTEGQNEGGIQVKFVMVQESSQGTMTMTRELIRKK